MCPLSKCSDAFLFYSLKVFLLIWIIFVPVVITARLDKIIKLLEGKDKK